MVLLIKTQGNELSSVLYVYSAERAWEIVMEEIRSIAERVINRTRFKTISTASKKLFGFSSASPIVSGFRGIASSLKIWLFAATRLNEPKMFWWGMVSQKQTRPLFCSRLLMFCSAITCTYKTLVLRRYHP